MDEVLSRARLHNIDSTTHLSAGEMNIGAFAPATGVDIFIAPFELTVEHSQTHTKTKSDEEETQVTVVLGDDDVGDEFVVDMYADPRYRSLVFDTVAGRSKCPNEYGTVAIEDPSIEFGCICSASCHAS